MRMIELALHSLAIGSPARCESLTVYPLFGPQTHFPAYITLDEALECGQAQITEARRGWRISHGSGGGSGAANPVVCLISRSPQPIFLLDGQELLGAMQDRVLNISLLAPPGRRLTLPVSCVEAARWEPKTDEFSAAPRVHFASGRAQRTDQVTESLLGGGRAESDQVEVWSTLERAAQRLDAVSPTRAHSALFDRHARPVEAAARAIRPSSGQTGALFAAGDSIIGMDLFDSASTLGAMLPRLVRSAAVDAIDAAGPPPQVDEAAQFIDRVARARRLRFAAMGIGVDVRLCGDEVAGGALTAWGRLVHLAAFAKDGEPG